MVMRRWCRLIRGIALGILAVAVVMILLKELWPTYDPRPPTTIHLRNASTFLNSLHHMSLDPVKVREKCKRNEVDVLLIVPSSVANLKARQAVRRSWGAHLPSSWQLIFYIGETADSLLQDQVRAEAEKHGDIAQDLSFYDSYSNLTLKTLSLLSWTQSFCMNASFILKIDDDIFLNVQRLYSLTVCVNEARKYMYSEKKKDNSSSSDAQEKVTPAPTFLKTFPKNLCDAFTPYQYISYFINSQTHEYESYLFGGYLYNRVKADRDPYSKWYLDPKIYPNEFLPPFLSGTSYIMTSNIIRHLIEAAKFIPLIELEDVYISGLVGNNGLKMRLSHLDGWNAFRPRWDSPCTYRKLFTSHGLSPSEMLSITQALHNLNHGACDHFLVYITNAFDSIISYIFPRLPSKDN
ncbi:beta-1,3-galactosyltransferase 5 [Procambarus clarkii]|uniref:beta-1,3-galactosyltransferase 5 n=1 Tax=Procambarus clarkii TaxID=6728 RepID=UPI00374243A8